MNSADILTKRALLTPSREALIELATGVHYTYAELNQRANRAANFLSEKYGVGKGDRVSILAYNSVAYLDLLFGVGKLGAILIAAKEYAYGIKIQSRKGERFEIPVEPIIDMVTYERFVQMRASKRTHPANHVEFDYLIGGVLYCPCGLKWGARTQRTRKNKDGVVRERKSIVGIYYCTQNHLDLVSPDCPRHTGAKKAEAQVWEKVCEAVDNPQYLVAQAHQLVEDLRASATNIHEERARIEKEMEALTNERQSLITWARQGRITATDMENQLSAMTLQELSLKHELSSLGQRINLNSLNDWEEKFMEYLADLQVGVEELKNVAPQNNEERHNVFLLKKQIVDTLVYKATIDINRKIMVDIRLNLLAILDQDAKSTMLDLAYIGKGETYTRTSDSVRVGLFITTI